MKTNIRSEDFILIFLKESGKQNKDYLYHYNFQYIYQPKFYKEKSNNNCQ